jgi:hypothetical protein
MKHIAIILIALLANLAVGSTSVTVYGYGSDRELAKKDAIRTASEKYCGTNVLSDRIHKNRVNTYNKVTLYNSCFLETIKMVDVSEKDNLTQVTLELELRKTNQSQRLNIRTGENSEINGEEAQFVIDRVNDKDKEALDYLSHFLDDYPTNAYSIVNDFPTPYFHYNKNAGKTILIVPYAFQGNKNYFKAMETTLLSFGKKRKYFNEILKTDHIGRPLNNFDIINKQITVDKTKIVIDDMKYFNFVQNTILEKHPVLRVEIYNKQDKLVSVVCSELLHEIRLPALGGNLKLNHYVSNTTNFLYAGDTKLRKFQLEIELTSYGLKPRDLGTVQTYILPHNECGCERFISSQTYN